jgi:WD40 repeat protein
MRRSVPRRCPSSRRRGLLGIEYLRELAAIVGLVLLISSGLSTAPHSGDAALMDDAPCDSIIGLGFNATDDRIWVNRIHGGTADYDLHRQLPPDPWPINGGTFSLVARGGTDLQTTVISDAQSKLTILCNGRIHVRFQHQVRSCGVLDVAVASNGRAAFACDGAGHLHGWDWNGETFVDSVVKFSHPVEHVATNHDGTQLLIIMNRCTAVLWDRVTGQERWRIDDVCRERITSIAWSADASAWYFCSEDGRLYCRDAAGHPVWNIPSDNYSLTTIAVSPNGRWVATGGFDKTVRLYEACTGIEVQKFVAHSSNIKQLAFDPQSQRLASGSLNGRVYVWSLSHPTQMQELRF